MYSNVKVWNNQAGFCRAFLSFLMTLSTFGFAYVRLRGKSRACYLHNRNVIYSFVEKCNKFFSEEFSWQDQLQDCSRLNKKFKNCKKMRDFYKTQKTGDVLVTSNEERWIILVFNIIKIFIKFRKFEYSPVFWSRSYY